MTSTSAHHFGQNGEHAPHGHDHIDGLVLDPSPPQVGGAASLRGLDRRSPDSLLNHWDVTLPVADQQQRLHRQGHDE